MSLAFRPHPASMVRMSLHACWWLLFATLLGWLATWCIWIAWTLRGDTVPPVLDGWLEDPMIFSYPVLAVVIPTAFWWVFRPTQSCFRAVRSLVPPESFRNAPGLGLVIDDEAERRSRTHYLVRLTVLGIIMLLGFPMNAIPAFYKIVFRTGIDTRWPVSIPDFLLYCAAWVLAVVWHMPLESRIVGTPGGLASHKEYRICRVPRG